MRIGIVKPDYNIRGGFEVVVDRLRQELEKNGYMVDIVKVDATKISHDEIPYPIDKNIFNQNPDFFNYINSFWKYMKLDLSMYDAVISTQPPSFAINHDRHISLFYHHLKYYYELSDVIQEIGQHKPYHHKAVEIIREIDSEKLSKVSTILAGSKTIKHRIKKYNSIEENVDVIYAGIEPEIFNYQGPINYKLPVVIGRHEFPKRPELFVAALKRIPTIQGRIVGEGGRTPDLKKIDQILTILAKEDKYLDDEFIWKKMSNGYFLDEHERLYENSKSKQKSNIEFTGRVPKEQLLKEYADALCVVCPAFEEDYGLTAIEAMSFKKPVIVCADGGGYTELVNDGITGFIVEPTSEAIAKAVKYFVDNPGKAVEMGQNAYEYSRQFTWNNTINKVLEVLKGK